MLYSQGPDTLLSQGIRGSIKRGRDIQVSKVIGSKYHSLCCPTYFVLNIIPELNLIRR